MVKNQPANAGDTGLIPVLGRSTRHRATKPGSRNYWAFVLQLLKAACPGAHGPQQEKPLQREAHPPHRDSSPCSAQLEKNPCSKKTQHIQNVCVCVCVCVCVKFSPPMWYFAFTECNLYLIKYCDVIIFFLDSSWESWQDKARKVKDPCRIRMITSL